MAFMDPTPPTFMAAAPGSYPETAATYGSVTEFVGMRPERVASRERDFGLAWRDGPAVYRAAWIADTGELYVVQLGAPAHGGGHVELLAAGADIDLVQRALAGWHVACGAEESLAWLRERVARRLSAPPEPALG